MAYVSLPSFRQTGDADDSAALMRALATGQQVYLPAGQGSHNGEYLIGTPAVTDTNPGATGNLRSGAYIFGDGAGQTVVRQRADGQYVFAGYGTATDVSGNIAGVTFRDFTIRGNVDTTGFNEQEFMVLLAGVSDFRAERINFVGFRGDAIFLGHSLEAVERHNVRLTITNCVFDGINRQNRNAISIYDATDWTVSNCTFQNMTADASPNGPMPGPIDVEPTRTFNRVTRGQITQCGFLNNGGYALNVILRPDQYPYAQPINTITMTGCAVQGSTGALRVFGVGINPNNPDTTQKQLVTFDSNYVYATGKPFILSRAYGVKFTSNTVVSSGWSQFFPSATSVEIDINNNQFSDCAHNVPESAVIVQDEKARYVNVNSNYFLNCGNDGAGLVYWLRGDASYGYASIDHLSMVGNTLENNVEPKRLVSIGQQVGGSNGAKTNVTISGTTYRNVNRGIENLG